MKSIFTLGLLKTHRIFYKCVNRKGRILAYRDTRNTTNTGNFHYLVVPKQHFQNRTFTDDVLFQRKSRGSLWVVVWLISFHTQPSLAPQTLPQGLMLTLYQITVALNCPDRPGDLIEKPNTQTRVKWFIKEQYELTTKGKQVLIRSKNGFIQSRWITMITREQLAHSVSGKPTLSMLCFSQFLLK